MTPQTGQHVKIVFRNSTVTEGIVEEWFNNHVQLRSLDGESILLITHPTEDIMLIKIVLDKPKEEEEPFPAFEEPVGDAEQKFEEFREQHDPNNPNDRKTLAELRLELAKQEKEIIVQKLREHRPSQYKPGTTPYHYAPVIFKNKSAYQPGRIPDGHSGSSKKPRTK